MSDQHLDIFVFNEKTESVEVYKLLHCNNKTYLLLDSQGNHLFLNKEDNIIGRSETEVLQKWTRKLLKELAEGREELKRLRSLDSDS